jgi:phosphatidylglycerophosphatase A
MSNWRGSVALWVASVAGLGFVPIAPGTAGSALPALLACWFRSRAWMVCALCVACILGYISVSRVLDTLRNQQARTGSEDYKSDSDECNADTNAPTEHSLVDPSYIVIDEVIGQLLCLIVVSSAFKLSFTEILISFLLFRVCDILKPWPIRHIERTLEQIPAYQAFSIIIDDVLAGLLGGVLAIALLKLIN